MKYCQLFFLCYVIVEVSLPKVSGEDSKLDPEVKWARGVASDFLSVAVSGDTEVAAGLLSPQLKDTLDASFPKQGGAITYLHVMIAGKYDAFSFSSATMAPNRSEVIVRGTLSGKGKKSEVVIRVAKQAMNGNWNIRFFAIREPKK